MQPKSRAELIRCVICLCVDHAGFVLEVRAGPPVRSPVPARRRAGRHASLRRGGEGRGELDDLRREPLRRDVRRVLRLLSSFHFKLAAQAQRAFAVCMPSSRNT